MTTPQLSPRIICDLQLNSIPLEISDKQYQSFVCGARTLHQLGKQRKNWRYRPLCSVKESVRQWWQYAVTVHLEDIRRRRDSLRLERLAAKCRANIDYVNAFKTYLSNPIGLDPGLTTNSISF